MAVSFADVALELGRPTPAQDSLDAQRWTKWIEKANLMISAGPDGSSVVDLGSLDQARLDMVVLDTVVARAQRPDDADQIDMSVDDGRVSKIFRTSSDGLQIRPRWWAFLGLTRTAGAYTVRPSFEPDRSCW